MECETGGEITWTQFERGMKKLHCTSIDDVKARLDGLRSTLALADQFDATYRFAFKLNLEPNKKILSKDIAVALWELLLTGKFAMLDKWIEFVETRDDIQWISKDVFHQLHSFSKKFGADLSAWQDDGAWPCVIDDFVEFVQEKKK
jgi:DCN1-like protein 1/2